MQHDKFLPFLANTRQSTQHIINSIKNCEPEDRLSEILKLEKPIDVIANYVPMIEKLIASEEEILEKIETEKQHSKDPDSLDAIDFEILIRAADQFHLLKPNSKDKMEQAIDFVHNSGKKIKLKELPPELQNPQNN